MRGKLRTIANIVAPIALALGLVVIPAVPSDRLGPLEGALTPWRGLLRSLSFSQSWRMYTPDANRSYSTPLLRGTTTDGETRILMGAEPPRPPDGGVFFWNRRRADFWTYQAVHAHPKRRNGHRLWWLRGACVTAAREGLTLRSVELTRVNWRMARPVEVAKGAAVLRAPKTRDFKAVRCDVGVVKTMIAEDEERRDHGR